MLVSISSLTESDVGYKRPIKGGVEFQIVLNWRESLSAVDQTKNKASKNENDNFKAPKVVKL